jgi:hypothetical protein
VTYPYFTGAHVTPTSVPALPTPPAVRPTRRQTLARRAILLVRVSAWGVGMVLGLLAVALFLYMRRGDVQGARRAVAQELNTAIDPDEHVVHAAHVLQRHWQDYYRETHGIVAATDRRMLYLGAAPREIVSPEDGPQLFERKAYPYDRPLVTERGRVFLGTARGVVLLTTGEKATFAVAADDRAEMDSVIATVHRIQAELRATAERERRAQTFAAWADRRPVYHRVHRGEALISIAQQYGTTPEAIQAWNGLSREVVKVGQRLLVKPGA